MTTETIPDGVPAGWVLRPTKRFATHVGPFYTPAPGDDTRCGFLASEKHGNKRGVVHGGMLATAFDVCLGNAAWASIGEKPCATVQLNVQFIGALKLGEFADLRAEVMRVTRSVIFLRGTMHVGERLVASADGVWKILEWRGEAFQPSSGA